MKLRNHFCPGLFSLKGVSLLSFSKNIFTESRNSARVRPKPRLALSTSQVASRHSSAFVMKGSGPHLIRFVRPLHLSCTVLWDTPHLLAAFRMLHPSSISFTAFSMRLSLSKSGLASAITKPKRCIHFCFYLTTNLF